MCQKKIAGHERVLNDNLHAIQLDISWPNDESNSMIEIVHLIEFIKNMNYTQIVWIQYEWMIRFLDPTTTFRSSSSSFF